MSSGPAAEAVLGGPLEHLAGCEGEIYWVSDLSLLDVSPVLCHAGALAKSGVYSAPHWFLAMQLKEGLAWLQASSLHYFMSFQSISPGAEDHCLYCYSAEISRNRLLKIQ